MARGGKIVGGVGSIEVLPPEPLILPPRIIESLLDERVSTHPSASIVEWCPDQVHPCLDGGGAVRVKEDP